MQQDTFYAIATGVAGSLVAAIIIFLLTTFRRRWRVLFTYPLNIGPYSIFPRRSSLLIVYGSVTTPKDSNRLARVGDVNASTTVALAATRYVPMARVRTVCAEDASAGDLESGDLLLVGGPNVNHLTAAFLESQATQGQGLATFDTYGIRIQGRDTGYWPTLVGGVIIRDYGLIYSFPHPADSRRRVTIIAGSLRVGTLAAAQTLARPGFIKGLQTATRSRSYAVIVQADVSHGDVHSHLVVEKVQYPN